MILLMLRNPAFAQVSASEYATDPSESTSYCVSSNSALTLKQPGAESRSATPLQTQLPDFFVRRSEPKTGCACSPT